ncbi:caspase family protein [Desulfobacterales bacterium HSG16]|nr:caspase family protein [Desulfobacterales bacterium HSG16]
MKKLILVILSVLLPISASNVEAGFRALLVGINYENADSHIQRLSGAVNDILDMRDYMAQAQGIPASSIRILTEEHATRKAILANFQSWLIKGTSPGDIVFFQYSGHGHQLPDPFGFQYHDPVKTSKPEYQKLAEAFVPYDTVINPKTKTIKNLILDSEFRLLLSSLQDRKIHLFLDCCHSQGATRDFNKIKAVSRNLQLPWDISQTRFEIPNDFPEQVRNAGVRGIFRIKSQNPDYAFFAAARYFQSAYEYPLSYGKNGAFTFSALQLLRANPGKVFTNAQILDYSRKFINHSIGIPEKIQEPIFHGPKGSEHQPFILLTLSGSSQTPLPKPSEIAKTGKTAVWITGQSGKILKQVKAAIKNSDFCRIDERQPDVIVDIEDTKAQIHNAVGRRLKTIPLISDRIGQIMKSLEGIHIVRELAALENPSAPFAVSLWLDKPGKTGFKVGDRVTLYYKIDQIPQQSKAWLTLLNVAPDGTVSILYPQKNDFHKGPGEKLYLNAEVPPGKTCSIPKSRTDLKQGQNVAIDLRIRLEEGQEYFKAIVTSEPIDWDKMNFGEFRSRFKGLQAKGFAVEAAEQARASSFWSTASLRVEVRP